MAVDKLVDSSQLDLDLTSVANAIRAKSGGSSVLLFPAGFVSEINSIVAGGPTLDDWLADNVDTVNFSGNTIKEYSFAAHKGPNANGIAFNLPNITTIPTYCFLGTCVKSFSAPLVSALTGTQPLSCKFPPAASGQNGVIISLPALVTIGAYVTFASFGASDVACVPALLSLPNFTGRPSGTSTSNPLFGSANFRMMNAYDITEITQDPLKNVLPQSNVRVYIPSLTECLTYDFANMGSLAIADLPNLVTVGQYAFYRDSALVTVDLSAATSIGQNSFESCTALPSISLPEVLTLGASAFKGCTLLASVSLPKATSIGEDAFLNDTALTSISLPVATSIGNTAFNGCTSLVSASMPNITTLGTSAFKACSALTTVDVGKITELPYQCFYNCGELISLTMPYVTSIGYGSLQNCHKLANVDFSNITTLSTYSLAYCNALTSVDFGKLTAIPQYSVQTCANLKTVTLRKNTTLYKQAFYNCSNLDTLIIDLDNPTGTLPILNTSASVVFSGTKLANATSGGAIYVTDSRVNDLKARTNWASLADIIHPLSDLPAA